MNNEFKEKQEQEVIERLKILKTHYGMVNQVLKDYKEAKLIHYSETINSMFSGILYWVANNTEYVAKIKELEDTYNIKIYHCILTHYTIGDIFTMLYVGSEEEYWEDERETLKRGTPYVYGWNIDDDFLSEFGGARIRGVNGGLKVE